MTPPYAGSVNLRQGTEMLKPPRTRNDYGTGRSPNHPASHPPLQDNPFAVLSRYNDLSRPTCGDHYTRP